MGNTIIHKMIHIFSVEKMVEWNFFKSHTFRTFDGFCKQIHFSTHSPHATTIQFVYFNSLIFFMFIQFLCSFIQFVCLWCFFFVLFHMFQTSSLDHFLGNSATIWVQRNILNKHFQCANTRAVKKHMQAQKEKRERENIFSIRWKCKCLHTYYRLYIQNRSQTPSRPIENWMIQQFMGTPFFLSINILFFFHSTFSFLKSKRRNCTTFQKQTKWNLNFQSFCTFFYSKEGFF